MPPKPPQLVVSDHMNSVSGNDVMRLDNLERSRLVAASVESGDAFVEQADVALILDRRQLLPREHVQRPRRDHDEQLRPTTIAQRICQRAVEQPRVGTAHRFEAAVDERASAGLPRPARCTNRELMTGDSVTATMPETTTAAASVIANSRNSEPVRPPWKPIGA